MPEQPGAVVVARKVDLADPSVAAVLARLRRAWVEERRGHRVEDPRFEPRMAEWALAEAGHKTALIAQQLGPDGGPEPLGMVVMLEYRRMPTPGRDAGRWGYIGQMFVLSSHRDVGVGQVLLDAALAEAQRRRYERVVLRPTAQSVPFYRRAGFAPAGDDLLVHPLG